MIRLGWTFQLLGLFLTGPILASVHVVGDGADMDCTSSRNVQIANRKGLKVYKDPSVWDWRELEENPLLTVLTGSVQLKTGHPTLFRNFHQISRIYEAKLLETFTWDANGTLKAVSPELLQKKPVRILPVLICDGAYRATLRFVLEEDFKSAEVEEFQSGKLPPSTPGRPIPKLIR